VGKQLFIEQNNVRQDSTYPARVKKKNKKDIVIFVEKYPGASTIFAIYKCPRVAKKLHNLFVIKDINFIFFFR
jgi:hypothetical protein